MSLTASSVFSTASSAPPMASFTSAAAPPSFLICFFSARSLRFVARDLRPRRPPTGAELPAVLFRVYPSTADISGLYFIR